MYVSQYFRAVYIIVPLYILMCVCRIRIKITYLLTYLLINFV